MYFVAIMLAYSGLFLLPLIDIHAQITDIHINKTVESNNLAQTVKTKSCLNLMNPGMMTMNAYDNINGSIKLDATTTNYALSKIKISLSQAATTAEEAIGNNSRAVEAYLCDANGYLVYMVWIMNEYAHNAIDVIVNPANGEVLLKNSNLLQQYSTNNRLMMQNMKH
jgi:hypothetical protein